MTTQYKYIHIANNTKLEGCTHLSKINATNANLILFSDLKSIKIDSFEDNTNLIYVVSDRIYIF